MNARRAVAWLGLGSNLDAPARRIDQAFTALDALPETTLLAASRRYRTAPVGGPPDQPHFCNAAAVIATTLSPENLLDQLHAIEAAQDRVRDIRWGPRTLDLDILAYDDLTRTDRRLTLPHPRAHERAFVLVPLAEIAPALSLGVAGRVVDCLSHMSGDDITLWDRAS